MRFYFYWIKVRNSGSEPNLIEIIKDAEKLFPQDRSQLYCSGIFRYSSIENNGKYVFTSKYVIITSYPIPEWENRSKIYKLRSLRPISPNFKKATICISSSGKNTVFTRPRLSFESIFGTIGKWGEWGRYVNEINKAIDSSPELEEFKKFTEINIF